MSHLFHSITGRNLPKEAWADREDLRIVSIPVSGHSEVTHVNNMGHPNKKGCG
jgi:hypothetical protein